MLHLSSAENIQDEAPELISAQDLAQQNIDSVYNALSMDERLDLLSIHSIVENDTLAPLDSLDRNGVLFSLNTQKIAHPKSVYFQNEPLQIGLYKKLDSNAISRSVVGQSGQKRLAYYAQAMDMERVKKKGANIVLSSAFQTLNPKWENFDFGFQESPLKSEGYWEQILQASEDNGVKMGVHDFFYKEKNIAKTEYSDFLAIGLSGNRYYVRKGHGIIQLNDELKTFKDRLGQFNTQSIQSFLRTEMSYEGIILSEDFSIYSDELQITKAMQSLTEGSDMVCISAENKAILKTFLVTFFDQKPQELKARCQRILRMKYDLHQGREKSTSFKMLSKPLEYQSHHAALTCVRNADKALPIKNVYDTITYFTTEENSAFFKKEIEHFAPAKEFIEGGKKNSHTVLLDGFDACIDDAIRIATNSRDQVKYILITDVKSFYKKRTANWSKFGAVIVAPDAGNLDISLAIQSIFGSYDLNGALPYYHTPQFPQGFKVDVKSLGRLKYVDAAYLGIDSSYLNRIDKIAENGVEAKAFPGCQIMFGVEGHVVYQKNFGFHDYTKIRPVEDNTIYDIASISKIAASTVSLMALDGEGKFTLEDSLKYIIPEVVGENPMKNIYLKDMMAHQAGLPAWIPFYLKTLKKGHPNPVYYSNRKSGEFSVPVANNLWIRKDYVDTMYQRILSCDLDGKSYVYSDLGYYFVKKIIEKKSQKPMQDYVHDRIYRQLGLHSMTFNPYLKFDLNRIAPTENDRAFRKQIVHGYVHDPGSAMMGGVCGHAGVFSTANDLYILMQMLLNKGTYANQNILKEEVVNQYTSVQFPGRNRRGAGFDKPKLDGTSATACSDASPSSFGHSGFTGTVAWADPYYDVNFVFLSNRVNPSAENWKITKMDIRTNIQYQIYKGVKEAKNFNFLVSN
jgi:beta-N-acetylhexosaminidase